MKSRTIAAGAFIALMLVCGGSVLRQWQMKHPPKPRHTQGAGEQDGRIGRDRMGDENWRPALAKERAGAIACIDGQLAAFRKDDYSKALSFQSVILHSQFSSPGVFRGMIRNHYPEFANAKKVVYERAFADKSGHMVAIGVDLTGENNREVKAQYRLVLERDGYKVMGVGDVR